MGIPNCRQETNETDSNFFLISTFVFQIGIVENSFLNIYSKAFICDMAFCGQNSVRIASLCFILIFQQHSIAIGCRVGCDNDPHSTHNLNAITNCPIECYCRYRVIHKCGY